MTGIAAGAFITFPQGAVLISEGTAPSRAWKVAGGQMKEEDVVIDSPLETARRTAQREVEEETGISLPLERFVYRITQPRQSRKGGPHDYYFFTAEVTAEEVKNRGEPESGITVHVLTGLEMREKFKKIPPPYRQLLDKFNLWP